MEAPGTAAVMGTLQKEFSGVGGEDAFPGIAPSGPFLELPENTTRLLDPTAAAMLSLPDLSTTIAAYEKDFDAASTAVVSPGPILATSFAAEWYGHDARKKDVFTTTTTTADEEIGAFLMQLQ